jgi:hypothetical protein
MRWEEEMNERLAIEVSRLLVLAILAAASDWITIFDSR